LNILIFIPSLTFGGAEKQAILDANLLSEHHQVFLLSFYGGEQLLHLMPDVKCHQLKKSGYLLSALKLAKFIKENNISLIHASLFSAMVISVIASIIVKVSILWHFHSHEYDIPIKSKISFSFFARFLTVKKILFVSTELMEHFKKLKFPKNKLGVLYNHTELKSFKKEYNNAVDKIITFGYIGRVIKLKRVNYLIELAAYLKTHKISLFHIHIVGDGDEIQNIVHLAKSINVDDKITFHGFQTNVTEFYDMFDIYLNPSSEECLSMAMIDAGICALPIIAFNVGGNNEIVLNDVSGYIVDSKTEFFEKCKYLLLNPEKISVMGLNSKKHCEVNFSKEKHLKDLLEIYSQVGL